MPAQAGEHESGEHAAARREQRPAEESRRDERGGARERRGKTHAQDRRAAEREGGAVTLEVQNADAAVGLRDAVRQRADRIRKIRRAPGELERRPHQREIVDPEPLGNALECGEPKRRPGGQREQRQSRERRGAERDRRELLGRPGRARPRQKPGRRHRSGRGGSRGHGQTEEQTGRRPRGFGIREERRSDPSRERDGRHERRRASDEKSQAEAPRGPPRGPRRHFWKKRKRLTDDGPSEKKSPERRGRAQSSSESPARSSGTGIGSPFRYVPQVDRMSTRR